MIGFSNKWLRNFDGAKGAGAPARHARRDNAAMSIGRVAHGPADCLNQMPRYPTKPKSTLGGRHGNTKISPHWQTVPAAHRQDHDLESAGRLLVGRPEARENVLRRGGR